MKKKYFPVLFLSIVCFFLASCSTFFNSIESCSFSFVLPGGDARNIEGRGLDLPPTFDVEVKNINERVFYDKEHKAGSEVVVDKLPAGEYIVKISGSTVDYLYEGESKVIVEVGKEAGVDITLTKTLRRGGVSISIADIVIKNKSIKKAFYTVYYENGNIVTGMDNHLSDNVNNIIIKGLRAGTKYNVNLILESDSFRYGAKTEQFVVNGDENISKEISDKDLTVLTGVIEFTVADSDIPADSPLKVIITDSKNPNNNKSCTIQKSNSVVSIPFVEPGVYNVSFTGGNDLESYECDNVTVAAGATVPVPVSVKMKGTYYVSEKGDDSTGKGQERYPYKTISKALSEAGGRPALIIIDGTITDKVSVSGTVTLKCKEGASAATVTSSSGDVFTIEKQGALAVTDVKVQSSPASNGVNLKDGSLALGDGGYVDRIKLGKGKSFAVSGKLGGAVSDKVTVSLDTADYTKGRLLFTGDVPSADVLGRFELGNPSYEIGSDGKLTPTLKGLVVKLPAGFKVVSYTVDDGKEIAVSGKPETFTIENLTCAEPHNIKVNGENGDYTFEAAGTATLTGDGSGNTLDISLNNIKYLTGAIEFTLGAAGVTADKSLTVKITDKNDTSNTKSCTFDSASTSGKIQFVKPGTYTVSMSGGSPDETYSCGEVTVTEKTTSSAAITVKASAKYYVSASGDDVTGSGIESLPFKTISKVLSLYGKENPAIIIEGAISEDNTVVVSNKVTVMEKTGTNGATVTSKSGDVFSISDAAASLTLTGIKVQSGQGVHGINLVNGDLFLGADAYVDKIKVGDGKTISVTGALGTTTENPVKIFMANPTHNTSVISAGDTLKAEIAKFLLVDSNGTEHAGYKFDENGACVKKIASIKVNVTPSVTDTLSNFKYTLDGGSETLAVTQDGNGFVIPDLHASQVYNNILVKAEGASYNYSGTIDTNTDALVEGENAVDFTISAIDGIAELTYGSATIPEGGNITVTLTSTTEPTNTREVEITTSSPATINVTHLAPGEYEVTVTGTNKEELYECSKITITAGKTSYAVVVATPDAVYYVKDGKEASGTGVAKDPMTTAKLAAETSFNTRKIIYEGWSSSPKTEITIKAVEVTDLISLRDAFTNNANILGVDLDLSGCTSANWKVDPPRTGDLVPDQYKDTDTSQICSKYTIDQNAFNNNKKLTKVVLPPDLTTIGDHAFYLCTYIKEVYFPNTITTIEGDNNFRDCKHLATFNIENLKKVTVLPSQIFSGCNYTTDGKNTVLDLSSFTKLTKMSADVFSGNNNIYGVILPNQAMEFSSPFTSCDNLQYVVPADTIKSGTTPELGKIIVPEIPNSNPSYNQVSCYRNPVKYSQNMKVVDFSRTKFPIHFYDDFKKTTNETSYITTIILPNEGFAGMSGNAFEGCDTLTTICTKTEYPANKGKIIISGAITKIPGNVFKNCSGITKVKIGDNVTSFMSNAFTGTNLSELEITGSWNHTSGTFTSTGNPTDDAIGFTSLSSTSVVEFTRLP